MVICLERCADLFAYGPADATATHCLLLQLNPDWFYLSGTGLTRVVPGRGPLNGCVCTCSMGLSFRCERVVITLEIVLDIHLAAAWWVCNSTRFILRCLQSINTSAGETRSMARCQFNGGKNRGGSTSVRGRVRSPYISGGPADATATHCLLLQLNPDWFYLSGTG